MTIHCKDFQVYQPYVNYFASRMMNKATEALRYDSIIRVLDKDWPTTDKPLVDGLVEFEQEQFDWILEHRASQLVNDYCDISDPLHQHGKRPCVRLRFIGVIRVELEKKTLGG